MGCVGLVVLVETISFHAEGGSLGIDSFQGGASNTSGDTVTFCASVLESGERPERTMWLPLKVCSRACEHCRGNFFTRSKMAAKPNHCTAIFFLH